MLRLFFSIVFAWTTAASAAGTPNLLDDHSIENEGNLEPRRPIAPEVLPITDEQAKNIDALIEKLGDTAFMAREKAERELIELGMSHAGINDYLRVKKTNDAEIRSRLARIVKKSYIPMDENELQRAVYWAAKETEAFKNMEKIKSEFTTKTMSKDLTEKFKSLKEECRDWNSYTLTPTERPKTVDPRWEKLVIQTDNFYTALLREQGYEISKPIGGLNQFGTPIMPVRTATRDGRSLRMTLGACSVGITPVIIKGDPNGKIIASTLTYEDVFPKEARLPLNQTDAAGTQVGFTYYESLVGEEPGNVLWTNDTESEFWDKDDFINRFLSKKFLDLPDKGSYFQSI